MINQQVLGSKLNTAALRLVLDLVQLFSSLNTKYPENKTIPKWLVDRIMIVIVI